MFGSAPWGANPWASAPIARYPGIPAQDKVTRVVVEVIASYDYTPDIGTPTVTRQVLEVIATMSSYTGPASQITRAVAEVIASVVGNHRGLDLPAVSLTTPSIFMVLKPESWATGGEIFLQNAAGYGLRVRGNDTNITVSWSSPTASASSTFAKPAGAFRLGVIVDPVVASAQIRVNEVAQSVTTSGSAWSAVALTDLNVSHALGFEKSGQIAELMVHNRTLTGSERAVIEGYLQTKWP